MMLKMLAGSTSQMVPFRVQDTTSVVGAQLAGLLFNSTGLAAKYRRAGANSWTTITLVTATLGTFTSGGFIANGLGTGGYELGVPDAALAAGARWVEIEIYGGTNMLTVPILIELDTIDYQNANWALMLALHGGMINGNVAATANIGTSSVQLASDTSTLSDDIVGKQSIWVYSGPGAGQTNKIMTFENSTQVAVVETPWVTQLTTASKYVILGRVE